MKNDVKTEKPEKRNRNKQMFFHFVMPSNMCHTIDRSSVGWPGVDLFCVQAHQTCGCIDAKPNTPLNCWYISILCSLRPDSFECFMSNCKTRAMRKTEKRGRKKILSNNMTTTPSSMTTNNRNVCQFDMSSNRFDVTTEAIGAELSKIYVFTNSHLVVFSHCFVWSISIRCFFTFCWANFRSTKRQRKWTKIVTQFDWSLRNRK